MMLLDAGRDANFRFRLFNCTDRIMERVNAISGRNEIELRMSQLISFNCRFEYFGMLSEVFEKNLRMVDSIMPQILSKLIYSCYSTRVMKMSDAVLLLEHEDPLGVKYPGYYQYKIKSFLRAVVLGMSPCELWDGKEDVNISCVVPDDSRAAFSSLYNSTKFEQELLECSWFDDTYSSFNDFMKVLKIGGEYFIDLNLKISFIKSDCTSYDEPRVFSLSSAGL